jgi:hypothetical protein
MLRIAAYLSSLSRGDEPAGLRPLSAQGWGTGTGAGGQPCGFAVFCSDWVIGSFSVNGQIALLRRVRGAGGRPDVPAMEWMTLSVPDPAALSQRSWAENSYTGILRTRQSPLDERGAGGGDGGAHPADAAPTSTEEGEWVLSAEGVMGLAEELAAEAASAQSSRLLVSEEAVRAFVEDGVRCGTVPAALAHAHPHSLASAPSPASSAEHLSIRTAVACCGSGDAAVSVRERHAQRCASWTRSFGLMWMRRTAHRRPR